jgi:endonuclease G
MTPIRLLLVFLCAFFCAAPAWAQPQPRTDPLEPTYEHDRWNTQPKDIVRQFRAFTTNFDGPDDDDGDGESDLWGMPEFVSYELRAGPDLPEFENRPSPWLTDPILFSQGVAPADNSYHSSGYSRGHLCMRHHARRLGQNADWNTHTTLNACPQLQDFNGGHWLSLETLCSLWANGFGKVWIICGPIVAADGSRTPQAWIGQTGEKEVVIPEQFFKIVIRESGTPNRPDVMAFIYDHDPALGSSSVNVDHSGFLHSVRDIEELTGLDFFTSLPEADQDAIEMVPAGEVWPHLFAFAPSIASEAAKRPILTNMDVIGRIYKSETDQEFGGPTSPSDRLVSPSSVRGSECRCPPRHWGRRRRRCR